VARFRAARTNGRPRQAELAPPVLHGTTTRHLRSGRRNNSPRLVAHRFTAGDVPLCGRSTLSDPDTARINVDHGRSTAATTATTTTTGKTARTTSRTSTRERGTVALDAVAPFGTYHARIICVPDVRVVPYRPPEEARGAATRTRKACILVVVVVSRVKRISQSSRPRNRVRE